MTTSALALELDPGWPVPYGHRSPSALRFRRKFERFFPAGFQDQSYLDRERTRKWRAHERWSEELAPDLVAERFEGWYREALRA